MAEENEDFDRWCYTAPSDVMLDERPLPLLTILLHRVCGNDPKKFNQAIDILRAAFEAGATSAR